MPKAYLVMLIVGAIVTVFLACIPYDFYRFRKRKKKVRDHQERLSLVTRIAPGHAKVVVEAVSSEDVDGHAANHPRKFGFKSLLSVFKFMAGGKLKAGPSASHSDLGGGESHADLEQSVEDGEQSKGSRSNGYRSVPTSSPRSARGQGSCESNEKEEGAKKTSRSAKSLVMTPHICRHKSCEHQPTSQGRAAALQRSSSDNPPPSYSSLAAPLAVSSHSAVGISEGAEACARYGSGGRSLTLELADIIAPASDSGTPTPTMSAPTSSKGMNGPQTYNLPVASGIQQGGGGLMFPYAYSPDYEEIETPRRAPKFFRGGAPAPNSHTNSSGTLIMGGAFGGKSSRQQQQARTGYGGRSLIQTDEDYEGHSFSSLRPHYGTGAVPKQNATPRSGLLVFQKASEIFHRRLEARRNEDSRMGSMSKNHGVNNFPPTSEDHWSFTEAPSTERNPPPDQTNERHRRHSHSSKDSVLSEESPVTFKPPLKQSLSEKKKDGCSKSPTKTNRQPVKTNSITSPSRRRTLAAPSSQTLQPPKNRRFQRSMARSYSQHDGGEDYLQDMALLDPGRSQADNLPYMPRLTRLSREEVNAEDAETDPDREPLYSMPYVAESPTMRDEERSLRFRFCPISSPKGSFDSAALDEDFLSLQNSNSLSSATPLKASSKETLDSGLRSSPDVISGEMGSLPHTATCSPSKDTLVCSNSSGKTTPEGSVSTVVCNMLVTSPQEELAFPSNKTHSSVKALSFEDSIANSSHSPCSRDRLSTQATPGKAITPTESHPPSTSLHPGLKPLTRAGSCSSPLDYACLAPPRTSPPSSTSSPDVLQLRGEGVDTSALSYHKTSKPRLSRSGLPIDVGAHSYKPHAQYKGALCARHYSLENQ